jgi:hypothetical protein
MVPETESKYPSKPLLKIAFLLCHFAHTHTRTHIRERGDSSGPGVWDTEHGWPL